MAIALSIHICLLDLLAITEKIAIFKNTNAMILLSTSTSTQVL